MNESSLRTKTPRKKSPRKTSRKKSPKKKYKNDFINFIHDKTSFIRQLNHATDGLLYPAGSAAAASAFYGFSEYYKKRREKQEQKQKEEKQKQREEREIKDLYEICKKKPNIYFVEKLFGENYDHYYNYDNYIIPNDDKIFDILNEEHKLNIRRNLTSSPINSVRDQTHNRSETMDDSFMRKDSFMGGRRESISPIKFVENQKSFDILPAGPAKVGPPVAPFPGGFLSYIPFFGKTPGEDPGKNPDSGEDLGFGKRKRKKHKRSKKRRSNKKLKIHKKRRSKKR